VSNGEPQPFPGGEITKALYVRGDAPSATPRDARVIIRAQLEDTAVGNPGGAGAPKKAKVEVSADGESWTTALLLDKGSASESFTHIRPVRFIRVTSTAPANETEVLIVRNLVVE